MSFLIPNPYYMGAISMVLIIFWIFVGFLLGSRARLNRDAKAAAPVGATIAAVLGLLAFTLTFTFNIAANRFEARRGLLLEEANALGTLFLRSKLLPQALTTEVGPLVTQYAQLRVDAAAQTEPLAEAIEGSARIHARLWRIAVNLAREFPQSHIVALFISTLNDVIDLHAKRVTVMLHYRIPPMIWLMLALITSITMLGVGLQFGMAGRMSWPASLILALTFSAVVFLIADLDNQTKGLIRVKQAPLEELLKDIAQEEMR